MFLVWAAVILIALKATGIGPLEELSWWWVLAPLGLAFVWFEWIEGLLGLDSRKVDHEEWQRRRAARLAEQFPAHTRGTPRS